VPLRATPKAGLLDRLLGRYRTARTEPLRRSGHPPGEEQVQHSASEANNGARSLLQRLLNVLNLSRQRSSVDDRASLVS
jgi:hypothetical protein